MRNLLNSKRTAATKRSAETATADQIAYTLQSLAKETKRYGACHVPAWLVVRCGLGETTTFLGSFKIGMFGRSLSRFKVKLCK
jgi:hypothetical protein